VGPQCALVMLQAPFTPAIRLVQGTYGEFYSTQYLCIR
jgi:hypothetical protein